MPINFSKHDAETRIRHLQMRIELVNAMIAHAEKHIENSGNLLRYLLAWEHDIRREISATATEHGINPGAIEP